jgi:hypothetical protein
MGCRALRVSLMMMSASAFTIFLRHGSVLSAWLLSTSRLLGLEPVLSLGLGV